MEMHSKEDLKQKFQSMQKRQNEKLFNARTYKEKSMIVVKPNVNSFGVNDKLELDDIELPPNPNDIYTEELVMHLNSQIRDITDERNRLQKSITENEFEIKQLRNRLIRDKNMPATNDAASTKIVELSKRVRELNSELHAEKNKNFNETESPDDQQSNEDDSTMKMLQEKLKKMDAKVTEHRNNSLTLKQELKLANKALCQEVGEGVSYQKLMSSTSSWKGRAEQIVSLQSKVAELKGHLKSTRSVPDLQSDDIMMRMNSGQEFDQHKDLIKRLGTNRKEVLDKLAKELNDMKIKCESYKEKFEASKARTSVLANDNKSCKQQITTLLEKGANDDELVQALIKQQSHLKNIVDESNARLTTAESSRVRLEGEYSKRTQNETNIVCRLQAIADEKESRIQSLLAEQRRDRDRYDNEQRPSSSRIPRPDSSKMDQNTDRRSWSAASNTTSERENTDAIASQQANELKITSLQSQIDDSCKRMEQDAILLRTSSVENEKLSELLTISNNRLHELEMKILEIKTEANSFKRNNANLEKQLGKISLARKSQVKNSNMVCDSLDVESFEGHFEECKISLEIQRDENQALKVALERMMISKQEDKKLYSDMMQETKQVFLIGLRQYKQQ